MIRSSQSDYYGPTSSRGRPSRPSAGAMSDYGGSTHSLKIVRKSSNSLPRVCENLLHIHSTRLLEISCQKSVKPLALQQCSQLNYYGNLLFPTATNHRCPSYIAVLRIKDKLHLKRINFYNATKIAGCKF